MAPKLVIFDCDGVLVDSELIASRQLAAFLTELGRSTTALECRNTFTGMSIKSVGEHVHHNWGLTLPTNFVEQLRLRDYEAFATELTAIAGIEAVLDELKTNRIPFCVASSGTPEKIHHSLAITGLLNHFNGHVFSAVQVTHGKPAPDLFELAAYEMKARPQDCIVVEDAPPGVQGGVAAGMTVLGFCGGSHCTNNTPKALSDAGAQDIAMKMAEVSDFLLNSV
ncbi:MAG: HAD family hydrolase [Magnetovibrio sp.]|nr:HAD family hydrolase [Magnetovibrio sp.]